MRVDMDSQSKSYKAEAVQNNVDHEWVITAVTGLEDDALAF
jgi:hypothetical protein